MAGFDPLPATGTASELSRLAGFTTLPARMHEVHTDSLLGVAPTMARTRWMFGSHRRLVLLWEWLTLIPKEGCFPQISQTAAMAQG